MKKITSNIFIIFGFICILTSLGMVLYAQIERLDWAVNEVGGMGATEDNLIRLSISSASREDFWGDKWIVVSTVSPDTFVVSGIYISPDNLVKFTPGFGIRGFALTGLVNEAEIAALKEVVKGSRFEIILEPTPLSL